MAKSPFWTVGVPNMECVLSCPGTVGWLSLQKPGSQPARVECGSQRPEPQPFQQTAQESGMVMAPWGSLSNTGLEVKEEALGWPGLASSWPSNPLSVGPSLHHSEPLLSLATPQPGPPHSRSSTTGWPGE